MKVHELIKELKCLPKNADVYWADHDHSKYEWNSSVGGAEIIDYDKRPNDDRTDDDFILTGKIVMLRP